MQTLQTIKYQSNRVLTTQQLAQGYGTDNGVISKNFNNNKERYQKGKHYYILQGEELKVILQSYNLRLQNKSKIRSLYLWTERGAFLHAKSLNTDKAWEVYEHLVDFYFRAKEEPKQLGEHKYFPKYYKGEPIMPVRDFIEITGVNINKHKLFFREEYFKGGWNYNGLGWDLRQEFEKKYSVDYSEEETMMYMHRSGVLKAINILKLDKDTTNKLLMLMPTPVQPKQVAQREKPVTQYLITVKTYEGGDQYKMKLLEDVAQ